jgi:hypothetical protein
MDNIQQIDTELPKRFSDLGFEQGEWEMLIDGANKNYYEFDPDKIEQQYLDIAAANRELDQHDIVEKVLELYPYQPPPNEIEPNAMEIEGGKRKRRNKTKKSRKSKKSRKNKRRKTRRHRSMRKY